MPAPGAVVYDPAARRREEQIGGVPDNGTIGGGDRLPPEEKLGNGAGGLATGICCMGPVAVAWLVAAILAVGCLG
jgi:hypothetical protein